MHHDDGSPHGGFCCTRISNTRSNMRAAVNANDVLGLHHCKIKVVTPMYYDLSNCRCDFFTSLCLSRAVFCHLLRGSNNHVRRFLLLAFLVFCHSSTNAVAGREAHDTWTGVVGHEGTPIVVTSRG